MRLRDAEGWQRSLDANPPPSCGPDHTRWPEHLSDEDRGRGYGYCVMLAAERWANEMERRLAERPQWGVADVAQAAFAATDAWLGRWGLTGFQYGCAVEILAQVWEHGEALRRWHNLDTQIGDEGVRANERGGVLNPALLNIRDRE